MASLNPKQFDNILRRRNSVPPSATKLGGEQRLIGALDDVAAAELGMRPRIANVRQAELTAPLPPGARLSQLQSQPAIEIGRESQPVKYYESLTSRDRIETPLSDQRMQDYVDRELTFIPHEPHEHLNLADFRPDMLQSRENPTLPGKGNNWMLHENVSSDKYKPEVVNILEANAIRYAADPATGQQIPVTYNVKARDANGKPTAWDVTPMSAKTFSRLKQQQSIPISDRKVLRNLTPGEKADYAEIMEEGPIQPLANATGSKPYMIDKSLPFYRSLEESSIFTPKNFYTVDESVRDVDAIMESNQTDSLNDFNLIPDNALDVAASPNYAATGQHPILISDQNIINDQYREEWGDDIPNSPHLQNKRSFMPASSRLQNASQWRTEPQPQNVRQLTSGVEFVTPEVLAADAAYQQQLKSAEAINNMADKAHMNTLRNRQFESLGSQPAPQVDNAGILGAYLPRQGGLQPYAPRLNSTADDYDWDAMDADLADVHIELDGKHYPLTPSATVQIGGHEIYNDPNGFGDADILTAISGKQRELSSIQAKMNELRSSPTAQGEYSQLMNRAYQLQSGLDRATSAHNKLIGLEPLPEVRVTANPLQQSQPAQDPEIAAMYQAGLADQQRKQELTQQWQQLQQGARMQRIGTPTQPIEVIGDAEIGKALYPIRNARGAADEMAQFIEQSVNYPMSAADAAYESFTGQRRWAKSQPQAPVPGIEGSFGRLRASAPRSIAPADPRYVPDPFASPAQSSAFASPVAQPRRLALSPAAEVQVAPVAPPPRSAAEAAFRQWQPQPQTIDVPSVAVSPAAATRQPAPQPQEPNQLPSWAIPAAAGGAGLITVGGLGAAYYQHQQQKQAEDEARMRRAMGRG